MGCHPICQSTGFDWPMNVREIPECSELVRSESLLKWSSALEDSASED